MKNFILSGIRFFLGYTFLSAGLAKLFYPRMFPGWIGPSWLIERLEEYNLGMYGWFIALSQVVIGLLVMTRRFAILGSIMMVPMLMNILMITISQQWQGTPYIVAVLLAMNLVLLVAEYPRLRLLLIDEAAYVPKVPIRRRSLQLDFVWAVAFVLLVSGAALLVRTPLLAQVLLVLGGVCFLGLSVYSLVMRWKNRHSKHREAVGPTPQG